jgi:hypothetical protein
MIHSESHARAAERLRRYTERSNAAHRGYLGDAALLASYEAFLDWQIAYMSSFFDDLRISDDYSAAIEFFISDLTGIGISRRDEDLARVVPVMVKMLPETGLSTLSSAMEVNARVLEINIAICRELDREPAHFATLSEHDYCIACRRCSDFDEAMQLVGVLRDLGERLDHLIHVPLMGTTLHAMRWPARLAGFGSLQDFLETGYDRFHEIEDVDRFLTVLGQRMREVFEHIYLEPLENLDDGW